MRALLLIDHGSRNARANESLAKVAELVRAQLASDALVAIAHMELASPSIAEGVSTLVSLGASEIVAMPYFLAAGRHSTEDIPRLVREAMEAHPSITYRVAKPLGVDTLLATLVIQRASE